MPKALYLCGSRNKQFYSQAKLSFVFYFEKRIRAVRIHRLSESDFFLCTASVDSKRRRNRISNVCSFTRDVGHLMNIDYVSLSGFGR